MKNTKLIATLGAVALVAAVGIGSTFAYLTAETGEVKNTFKIGNVNFDLDGGLLESDVIRDKNTGKYVDNDGPKVWKSTGEEYTSLYPGEVVVKDPTVIMAKDSEEAWLFAKVVYDKKQYTIQYTSDWTVDEKKSTPAYDIVKKNTTIVSDGVEAKADRASTIFTTVTVKNTVKASDNLSAITIKAAAVQAAGLTQDQALAETNQYFVEQQAPAQEPAQD